MNVSVKLALVLLGAGLVGVLPGIVMSSGGSPPRASAVPSLALRKLVSSESGRAWGSIEVIESHSGSGECLALFKLVFINPDNGMLAETRRIQPLVDVVWPVVLTDRSVSGQITRAEFSRSSELGSLEVSIDVAHQ